MDNLVLYVTGRLIGALNCQLFPEHFLLVVCNRFKDEMGQVRATPLRHLRYVFEIPCMHGEICIVALWGTRNPKLKINRIIRG